MASRTSFIIKPIVPGQRLLSQSSLVGIRNSSAGALFMVRSDTHTHDGKPVCTQRATCLVQNQRLPKDLGESHPDKPAIRRNGEPDTATFPIDDQQTLRYAEAARDYSPYTLDAGAAREMGLPAAIVHGMCTLALVARSVVDGACAGDSRRLRRLGCRFSYPLYVEPQQALQARLWRGRGRRLRSSGPQRQSCGEERLCGGRIVNQRIELGTTNIPQRSQTWVTHQNVPPAWSAVPQQNIIEIVYQGCMEDPYRPVLVVEDGSDHHPKDFLERCQAFAGYLRGKVRAGDNVAVMLDNRVEFMIVLFAIIANRGTLVSIAPSAQQYDAGHIVKDAEPVAAICGLPQLADHAGRTRQCSRPRAHHGA